MLSCLGAPVNRQESHRFVSLRFGFRSSAPVTSAHDGKHLPKATSSLGDPLRRNFLRTSPHSRPRSFATKPSHHLVSAVTRKSAVPTCPSLTCTVLSRITTVAFRSSVPVNAKWYVVFRPSD